MKKQFITIIMILVLLAITLSGCEEQSGYLDNRFFGNWQNQIGLNVTYASNGSLYSEVIGWHATWEVRNGKICYTETGESSNCQDFTFSEDGNTLTVHMAGGDIIYSKKE